MTLELSVVHLEPALELEERFLLSLTRFIRDGRKKYFVRWLGYAGNDDSEVDEDDIGEYWKMNCSPVAAEQIVPQLRHRILSQWGRF
jgi:hypothetical protein